jgi:hypothetical protein
MFCEDFPPEETRHAQFYKAQLRPESLSGFGQQSSGGGARHKTPRKMAFNTPKKWPKDFA